MERIFLNYNNLTDKWESKRGNTTWGQLELDKAIKNQRQFTLNPQMNLMLYNRGVKILNSY